jgi:hypothetical protein
MDAGVSRLTFDVLFASREAYKAALHLNLFCASNVARLLGTDAEYSRTDFFPVVFARGN